MRFVNQIISKFDTDPIFIRFNFCNNLTSKLALYFVIRLTLSNIKREAKIMCDAIKAVFGFIGICIAFGIMGYVGYLLILKGGF